MTECSVIRQNCHYMKYDSITNIVLFLTQQEEMQKKLIAQMQQQQNLMSLHEQLEDDEALSDEDEPLNFD